MSPQLCCDEQRESRPLATSASESRPHDETEEKSYIQYCDANSLYGWTMSQKPSPATPQTQQDLDKKLWDEAVVRVNNELAARHLKAMNKPYNPVDEDEESESDDELGWGS